MARHVYFSFHFERDAWRVGQVRNSWIGEKNQLLDHADWEKVLRQGDAAVKNWIDNQMKGASVTVVLIGAETYQRPWVLYEIVKSHRERKGLLGVRLTGVMNQRRETERPGPDPIAACDLRDREGRRVRYPVYGWVADDGRQNLATWVEDAAQAAGRR